MLRVKFAGGYPVVLALVLLLAPNAWAQQGSGIAGLVRDTSGGVLPGVTVEASSPALIEKVRSVISDGEGRFNIVNLPPGAYAVTFTLPGFNTMRREGIELSAAFTAAVNVEMQVGALEETITVTGESPLVDVQNVTQQRILSADVLEALPTGATSLASLTVLIPGMSGTQDVGGLGAVQSTASAGSAFHGKTGRKWAYDGMEIMNMQGSGNASFVLNQSMVQETSIETGGAGADSQVSGISINGIPKQGGNTFSGFFDAMGSTKRLQADNIDDDLRARLASSTVPGAAATVNRLSYIYNVAGSFGGPIKQDKIWFYSGVRLFDVHSTVAGIFYNKTPGTVRYTPDFDRPAERWESYQDYATRITWQVNAKNKIGVYLDAQPRCDCRRPGNLAPEAQTVYDFWPQGLYQMSWSAPMTNRLLFEGGISMAQSTYSDPPPEGHELTPTEITINDSASGLGWGAPDVLRTFTDSHRYAERFAVSYVTGSHNFKSGFYLGQGVQTSEPYLNQSIRYTFNCANGYDACIPTGITLDAGPYITRNKMKADLAIYAQDQWSLNRLSVSAGLRLQYFNAFVRAQDVPATRFLPTRHFDPVPGVPLWKDISPRLGAAYDLFGNGKTALKFSFGRYSGVTGVNIASSNNPILTSINTTARNWTDDGRNGGIAGDFIPQCVLETFTANGECGATDNVNFGNPNPTLTRWDDAVTKGWGARDYLWDLATEVQQEITPQLSVYAGYYRNWDGNNTVTDNEAWVPADFSTYCVKAPIDSRLPNGGGYDVCGLYDISSAKRRASQNVVKTLEDTAGVAKGRQRTNNFVSMGFNARMGGNARLGGGLDTGKRETNNCFTVDSPQTESITINGEHTCNAPISWGATLQVKMNGSYNFPRDIVASFVYQNIAGEAILANWAAPNDLISPSLGRNLAACSNAVGACSSTATVSLIVPNSLFEPRRNQLDLRLGKSFRMGNKRLQGNLDLYNALNGNAIASRQNAYPLNWGSASSVLDARMLQISGNLTF